MKTQMILHADVIYVIIVSQNATRSYSWVQMWINKLEQWKVKEKMILFIYWSVNYLKNKWS